MTENKHCSQGHLDQELSSALEENSWCPWGVNLAFQLSDCFHTLARASEKSEWTSVSQCVSATGSNTASEIMPSVELHSLSASVFLLPVFEFG